SLIEIGIIHSTPFYVFMSRKSLYHHNRSGKSEVNLPCSVEKKSQRGKTLLAQKRGETAIKKINT
ncbi:MAG: hypothetical protein M0Q95_09060, partial [Porticoccaceae bacterium]|nr:hypothetical protein [Porticoccaceae bacterium]